MNHATRRPLYQQIEAERKTKVIAFITGERPGFQTQIASDAVTPLVTVLDKIGPVERLSLVLETSGGSTSAAWRMINIIRTFCDDLEVIIPNKAMSAGTLMTLAANKIVMTKQAALGPIDPSLDNHPLAPRADIGGQSRQVSVSAEAIRGYIDEVKKDVTDQNAIATIWRDLSSQIHPLVLGQIFRSAAQIRQIAKDLIKHQIDDGDVQTNIIQFPCSDSGSHDYTINRKQAKEMGFKVEKPGTKIYEVLRDISKSYHDELETLVPLSVEKILNGQPSAKYTLVRGLIESADESYGYTTDGRLTVNQPPGAGVSDVKSFEGWRKL